MSDSKIDREKIHRPQEASAPSADSHIREVDDVVIQVTQVFCQNGHNLIRNQEELFDGAPGISLTVSDGASLGEVILSPFHGDHRRKGKTDFAEGARLAVSCPECGVELEELATCSCEEGGKMFKLYLTPGRSEDHIVALCSVWGCHRSKVFDQAQLLSSYDDE